MVVPWQIMILLRRISFSCCDVPRSALFLPSSFFLRLTRLLCQDFFSNCLVEGNVPISESNWLSSHSFGGRGNEKWTFRTRTGKADSFLFVHPKTEVLYPKRGLKLERYLISLRQIRLSGQYIWILSLRQGSYFRRINHVQEMGRIDTRTRGGHTSPPTMTAYQA